MSLLSSSSAPSILLLLTHAFHTESSSSPHSRGGIKFLTRPHPQTTSPPPVPSLLSPPPPTSPFRWLPLLPLSSHKDERRLFISPPLRLLCGTDRVTGPFLCLRKFLVCQGCGRWSRTHGLSLGVWFRLSHTAATLSVSLFWLVCVWGLRKRRTKKKKEFGKPTGRNSNHQTVFGVTKPKSRGTCLGKGCCSVEMGQKAKSKVAASDPQTLEGFCCHMP